MEKSLLESCVKRNLSTRKIAAELRCSQGNIKYWLRKYSLKTLQKNKDYLCSKCKETKKENFYIGIYTYCRKCHNLRRTKLNRINKEKAIELKGGKCKICGYSKSKSALEFHHTNPKEKDPNFYNLKNRTFSILKKEIEKCILVCANCHREIHDELRTSPS
jgi:hypothetical protein